MSSPVLLYGTYALRGLLSLVFLTAGGAKLAGAEMMVGTFDVIGWGQWFRFVTGLIEVGSAVLLWIPTLRLIGQALLLATMVCAILFHIFVLGPSLMPALILAILLVAQNLLERRSGA